MQRQAPIIFQDSYLQSDSTQSFIDKSDQNVLDIAVVNNYKKEQLSKSIGKNRKVSVTVSVIALTLASIFVISFGVFFFKCLVNGGDHLDLLLKDDDGLRGQSFQKFQDYKNKFRKFYPDYKSEILRYQVFHLNYEYIHKKNSDIDEYTLGINQFSDLTTQQFNQKYTGLIIPPEQRSLFSSQPQQQYLATTNTLSAIADKQDLSQYCLPARNQHTCGSCWAFSATSAIQCQNSRAFNIKQYLSPQQLIDCSFNYKNAGCVGGLMQYAYDYIIDNDITTQEKYPYTNSEHFCRFRGGKYSIRGYEKVSPFNIDAHLAAFSQHFVTVAISASEEMRFYNSGVLSEEAICGPDVNHGVVVTGYEIVYKEGQKCMRLKMRNSWGIQYGQEGYFYGDVCNRWCGMLAMSTYVIV